MIDKTKKIAQRYEELGTLISAPEALSDMDEWKKLVKEHSALQPIFDAHTKLVKLSKDYESSKAMLLKEKDPEMKEFLNEEVYAMRDSIDELNEQIKIMLLPKDENDDKNVIVEIRGGAGGDEAALFAQRLMNMYLGFAALQNWKVEMDYVSETEIGGIKEASFTIIGNGVYALMKYESGVHRVQRVPETESQGRIHTSTATVAILPEIDEINFEINEKDLKVDTYRASGAGGQHVNKTESAIRITHLPTNTVVACQQERSQIKNREKAMNMLKIKLNDYFNEQQTKTHSDNRKSQVGTGDRSERIRTYNFPQGRVTDHRIGYTVYSLDAFLSGDIGTMIQELTIADQKIKLEHIATQGK